MPQVEHIATTGAPVEAVWTHVSDMGNWAPEIMGYQSHVVESDRRSVWTVKGDVGPLARTVRIAVDVTEWREPERVSFSVHGMDEQLEGTGSFTLSTIGSGTPSAEGMATPAAAGSRRSDRDGRLRAVKDAVSRWTLGRLFGRRRIAARDGSASWSADPSRPLTSEPLTELRFELTVTAGGMMGAVVNAMIEPLLEVATRDLAASLIAAIERRALPAEDHRAP